MNKSLIKYMLIAGLAMPLTSCSDFLNEQPHDQISAAAFYQSPKEIQLATNAIYDALQAQVQTEFAITEMRTDNSKARNGEGSWAEFQRLIINPNNNIVAQYWKNSYAAIFRANTVLANLGNAYQLENGKYNGTGAQYEGEALFVRALMHFKLVRLFGQVPMSSDVATAGQTEKFKQVNPQDVYAMIISDLEKAVEDLPVQSATQYGRATKGAAQALLAKVYLTQKEYTKALPLLKSVIDSGEYKLQSDFHDIFYNEGNDEVMFAIQYIEGNKAESQQFSDYFHYANGAGGLNYATKDLQASWEVNDKRKDVTQVEDPKNVENDQSPCYQPGKYLNIDPTSNDVKTSGNDWIEMRYADVLLMYAEAQAAGSATTDGEALKYFNEVRDRAGLPAATEITQASLLNERRHEFAMEDQRLFDLQRFGKWTEVMEKFQGSLMTPAQPKADLPEGSDLLPIPQREINTTNGILVQNPGYRS
ncbi:RagB/SusD family nutrient uptake outer membrane protein [Persicobacter psychrovividus]|uniref:Membrane protein n=1 Tax=Persicobacter psychrovividus TaxID=387638 RepID=A0ABM7VIW1_9BACT|nr:membrane protein [Persicobacter psychrovividus]